MGADHEQLVECMDAIAAAVSKLAAGDSLADVRQLWQKYETFMLPHLHEEEQVGLPLARAYFSPAEIDKIVSKILANSEPVSARTKKESKENAVKATTAHAAK